MAKLLTFGVIGLSSWGIYRYVTEFETNVTVNNKSVKSCLFGNVGRYMIETNQGSFVVGKDLKSWQTNEVDIYDSIEINQNYHITAYGIDYPKLHLYKKIVKQIGTPCEGSHCYEKESVLSKIKNKF